MIRVEFYGVPRSRAGVDAIDVPAGRLSEVLTSLAMRLPTFADECLNGNALQSGYLACINGTRFTTDGECTLNDGDALLILSADVGGC
ncbi:MAG: MoaD/ThiS family protein [Planctomycetaceae bacterium]